LLLLGAQVIAEYERIDSAPTDLPSTPREVDGTTAK
jgi:hypothetical protein